MKEVRAYIKPHKLVEVLLALHKVEGLTGLSISEIKGLGRGGIKDSQEHLTDDLVNYIPHVRIEIVCHDELVEEIVSRIQDSAHTGLRGDGKIYVSAMETAVRISTGERGEAAV